MVGSRYCRSERAVILAFAAVAIAFCAMVACGGPDVLREPAWSLALLPTLLAAAAAWPFLVLFLTSTRLDRSLPLVGAVAVSSTWLSFRLLGPWGLALGLAAAVAAMVLCRRWFRQVATPRSR